MNAFTQQNNEWDEKNECIHKKNEWAEKKNAFISIQISEPVTRTKLLRFGISGFRPQADH